MATLHQEQNVLLVCLDKYYAAAGKGAFPQTTSLPYFRLKSGKATVEHSSELSQDTHHFTLLAGQTS